MKLLLPLFLVGSFVGQSVNALSCMPANLARSFNFAVEDEKLYTIVYGKLRSTVPYKDPNRKRKSGGEGIPFDVPAQMTAQFVTANGLSSEKTFPILAKMNCAAHWCGGFPEVYGSVILFLEKTDAGYVANFGPCRGQMFERPDHHDITMVQKCLRRGKCSDAMIRRKDRLLQ